MQDAKQNSREPHAETLRKKKIRGKKYRMAKKRAFGKDIESS